MSEPKLISPMLDNFDMGGPISDHDGVKCWPAMRKNSDEKYIVKIISVPASQTKLDALLLTGAYPDKHSALAYFEQQANRIVDEKKILDNLSQLEGFIPFEDCQIVPMDDATGYDVYLLSTYKSTLKRQNSRAPMPQLEAVNLGLDICAALSVCRRSGYLYVDLKPSNIYIVGDKVYRIGDLGLVSLNGLKYASLPDRYRSSYTAPEVEDAAAALNDTLDIYALGLILYQVFNGGELPVANADSANEAFAAPAYADEELAQIILKACNPNPAERWQDPVQMGQALVNYMQKNGVNDTPLTAENFGTKEEQLEVTANAIAEEINAQGDVADSAIETEEVATVNLQDEAFEDSSDELEPDTEDTAELLATIDEALAEESDDVTDSTMIEETDSDTSDTEAVNDTSEVQAVPDEPEDDPEQEIEEEEYDNLSFLDDLEEGSAQYLANMGEDYDGVSDDISDILNQIDALAAHQIPEPVVAPDPIEIKIPEPIVLEDDNAAEEAENLEEELPASDEIVEDDEVLEEELPYIPKKKRTGLIWAIIIALVVALGVGGYFFYTEYYLQPIHSLTLTGAEDELYVDIATDVDESLLMIICADSHGNKVTAPVVGGKAVFSGLAPDTAYTVTVEISGLHKLTGNTSKVYSTPVQTKIAQLGIVTGSESGSVILSFTVEGPDSEQWNVIYSAEGEAERMTAFPSHMVTLTGLTVGKEYTFHIEPVDNVYITGATEATYVAKNLICAENLQVTSCVNGELAAQWNAPEGESVAEWTVRCYSENGYDETQVTGENTIVFHDVDDSAAHTVEVTAAEMSVSQRISIGANSVTVTDFAVDATETTESGMLALSWNTNREIPANGWTIQYTVNGLPSTDTVTALDNSVAVPAVPNGNYVFTIIGDDGNAVLGGPFTYQHADASAFEAYSLTKDQITARLCKTPAESDWNYRDLEDEDYVNTFSAGEKVSMVLAHSGWTEASDDEVILTYAIYAENGDLLSFAHDTQVWKSMWYHSYCELDIPGVPVDAGTYNVVLYVNGAEMGSQKFEITA